MTTAKPKMEVVWIQNLKALVEHGIFRTDEGWKKIFIEQLDRINDAEQASREAMPVIHAAARKALTDAGHGDINNVDLVLDEAIEIISSAILAERERCISIVQSIETTSAQGMRAIDEIVRKVRGQE